MGVLAKRTRIIMVPTEEYSNLCLTPEEMRLFSLIGTDIRFEDLIQIANQEPGTLEVLLRELNKKGLVRFEEPKNLSVPKITSKPAGTGKRTILDQLEDDEKDCDLKSIPKSEREEILLLFESLPFKNYFELLQLDRDATDEEIRLSFTALSRRYHPDRFYEKPIGHYRSKLEAIFKQMNTAYRTLKDVAKRTSYKQTLPAVNIKKIEASERPKKTAGWLERMAKVDRYFKAALQDIEARNYLSAHTNLTLTLQFDPNHKEAKSRLQQIEPFIREKKAENMVKRAEEKWAVMDRDSAIQDFDEALQIAPENGSVNFSYGKALASLSGEKELLRARHLLEKAAKLKPMDIETHLTLVELYEKMGLVREAKEHLKIIRKLSGNTGVLDRLKDRFKNLF